MTTEKHTLEKLAEQMPGTVEKKDEKIHTALLLAHYAATKNVVSKGILPTPLFGISYDKDNHSLSFKEFEGNAIPKKSDFAYSSLDIIMAAHARSIPLIFEGDTGVGKTVTIEAYLRTTLPEDGSVMMSLSHQSFTDSPKAPFERCEMVDGMPVTYIDQERLRSIAAMYIDELNLGNPNDLLQLSLGRVLLSKERGTAGTLIPIFDSDGKVMYDEEKLKKMWLSGSQNPPKSRDAQFSGMELTASLKNRFLVVEFPKIIKSVGSTMWLADEENGLHGKYLRKLGKEFEKLTGVSISEQDLRQDDLSLSAYILDSERTEKAIIPSSLEFGDLIVLTLSDDLAESYDIEKQVVTAWQEYLPAHLSSNLNLRGDIKENQEVKLVKEILKPFDKSLTERDDAKIKSLADMFATMKSLKRAYQSDNPLESYLNNPVYITTEDSAAAATLLARNKQVGTDVKDPLRAVNFVLGEYVSLVDGLAQQMNIEGYTEFNTEDPNVGLKHFIYTSALNGAESAEDIVKKINHYTADLKNLTSNSQIRKIIIGRTVGDLATVSGFIWDHKDEIDKHLEQGNISSLDLRGKIKGIYENELENNPELEDTYAHRLPRVL